VSRYLFEPTVPAVAIAGEPTLFPVRRIYCVGRNYAEHAREMGADPERTPPFFFAKPADTVVADGAVIPYPPRTHNLHHEVELIVALKRGGRKLAAATALECVYGYAVGCDYTRRDLQAEAKAAGKPWDAAKGFDHSASVSAIQPAARIGHPRRGRIYLAVNDQIRQQGDISQMIWGVAEVLAELSTLFELAAGDLVYTGTPAGVGSVSPGDRVTCGVDGVATISNTIGEPA